MLFSFKDNAFCETGLTQGFEADILSYLITLRL